MAQLVKCSLRKHEDLNSMHGTQREKTQVWSNGCPCNSSTEKVETSKPMGHLSNCIRGCPLISVHIHTCEPLDTHMNTHRRLA